MGSQNEKCEVGFIGLGSMGFPMAENILKKGFSLCIYNRTKEKALPLLSQGAKWTPSPSEMAAGCNIVVSMVANDEALRDIVDGEKGLLRSSEKPSIHISMSTVSPRLSAELEEKHSAQGVIFLSAPVTGRSERAREGALWIFLAGNSDGKKKAAPVLEAMSCKIFDLGEHPSQASLFKLCNNFMILSFIESLSEAGALLEKGGLPFQKAAEVWGQSLFDSPILHTYAPFMDKRHYEEGGFALNLGLKDMRLLQACADQSQVPMPFLSELHEKLLISMTLGREKYDWSAIDLVTRESAGLKHP